MSALRKMLIIIFKFKYVSDLSVLKATKAEKVCPIASGLKQFIINLK